MVDGLTDNVVLFRYTMDESFMGDSLETTTESVVYANVPARITVLSGQQALEAVGVAGKEVWRVVMNHAENVIALAPENKGPLLLRLVTGTTSQVILTAEVYDVLKAKHQQDEFGTVSHTSLVIERR